MPRRSKKCQVEIYSQARIQAKREAQHRVVEMIIPPEREAIDVGEPLILAKNDTAAMTVP